jgi:hypothetical protein
MEVISGIIIGLDTDTRDSGRRILDFIEASHIAMATINLLQALPKTPLWDRLKRDNRLIEDERRDSNVEFLLPFDEVLGMWRETVHVRPCTQRADRRAYRQLCAGHSCRAARAQSLDAARRAFAISKRGRRSDERAGGREDGLGDRSLVRARPARAGSRSGAARSSATIFGLPRTCPPAARGNLQLRLDGFSRHDACARHL